MHIGTLNASRRLGSPTLPWRLLTPAALAKTQNLSGVVDQLLREGFVFRLGNQTEDRFGVAGTDMHPPVGPVDSHAVLQVNFL